ncbi:MAG: ribosome assembly cofactor RimP [Spirochaetaceae bacterium]|jgi:ribosome maturation factor RimP|nr:ribosome assembly cofactor RimP [Spirochaetaceae bacterium]
MRYTLRVADKVFDSVEVVVNGLAMRLVELSVSRQKGVVQVRAVIYKGNARVPREPAVGLMAIGSGAEKNGNDDAGYCDPPVVSIDDCALVHRAILPRLELAFPGQDIYIEVSSPGIERRIKDGAEFVHYIGRPVSCYRTDISDWTSGILIGADDTHIVIKGKKEMISLSYDIIAKAKLSYLASIAQTPQNARVKKEAAV